MKNYRPISNLSVVSKLLPWVTSNPDFKITTFLKSNIRKMACLRDKVTIVQEETILNIWNGTMFGDLDWPLNMSRMFVSISWASCSETMGCSHGTSSWYTGMMVTGHILCCIIHSHCTMGHGGCTDEAVCVYSDSITANFLCWYKKLHYFPVQQSTYDWARCWLTSTVHRRLRLQTSASTLASSGPCHTAAAVGRSQEKSWTDRQHSTMQYAICMHHIYLYCFQTAKHNPMPQQILSCNFSVTTNILFQKYSCLHYCFKYYVSQLAFKYGFRASRDAILTSSEWYNAKPRKCNQCVVQPVAYSSQNSTQQAKNEVSNWQPLWHIRCINCKWQHLITNSTLL